jgi:hypothetical protein
VRVLAALLGLAACAGPRRLAPEQTYELTDRVTVPYRVEPGRHAVRVRATCLEAFRVGDPELRDPCRRWYVSAALVFEGPARPPIGLELLSGDRVVAARGRRTPCLEDDLPPPRRPRCTLPLAFGGASLDAPALHVADLVIDNAGSARDATLWLETFDPHE